jgi:hypothetical protein
VPNGEPYLAAAYLVFLALVLAYVAIMAARLSRLERDLSELTKIGEDDRVHAEDGAPAAVEAAAHPEERAPEERTPA